MRIALAFLMTLHGMAHLVSFVEAWRLMPQGGFPYKTTILAGRVDLGDSGTRAVGVIWLLVAVAFMLAAAGAVVDAAWWMPVALGIAASSLLLSFVELPQAKPGLAINIAIIATLVVGGRFGWL
jgi:hypothetical protein